MQHKTSNHKSWFIMGLFLMIMILVGCTVSQQDVTENENANADTEEEATINAVLPSDTPVPSATPTALASLPSATPTSTVTAAFLSSHTPTATFTVIPTLTPLPTIPPQQRGQVYTELINSNGGCKLPCWWGFELGKTSLDEVRQLYTTFDAFITEQNGINGRSALYITFVDPQIENGNQVRHLFRVQDKIIIEAEIEVIYNPSYQLKQFLQELGQPSEVWLRTIPNTYEGVLPVSLRLFFPDQGILVSYAVFGERIDDSIRVCFDERGGAIFRLWESTIWNPDGDKGFIERANESSELTLEGHRPIDEVSNWDVGQFYTILADPTRTECLETPSNLWQHP